MIRAWSALAMLAALCCSQPAGAQVTRPVQFSCAQLHMGVRGFTAIAQPPGAAQPGGEPLTE